MPGSWLISSGDVGTSSIGDGDTRPGDGRLRALLIGLGSTESDPSLDELERLAETDGVDVVGRMLHNRDRLDPATYQGSGKVDDLAGTMQERSATLVIADGELTPAQVRNLEDRPGVRVVDRTALILDIFAHRAAVEVRRHS